ncbi:transmembrane protein, putative (macronuclear) [Tetrahymena thermophila SB210]|uniref:Transmembrane protein, putative n=1 Tax=Tetrahymena thermophila (strain SB210) TaxID=312017 RepID=W7XCW8_TETTS|nr:transmembrane protein, putative [Tetrahymena thermophila SB210]EWS75292.1 transmembrane protein, putative [Tetrahymena thermophila SB210]|eukprot:XP_012652283.1 transmembrane protein, putative [Tetrahymena thermophila SB210]
MMYTRLLNYNLVQDLTWVVILTTLFTGIILLLYPEVVVSSLIKTLPSPRPYKKNGAHMKTSFKSSTVVLLLSKDLVGVGSVMILSTKVQRCSNQVIKICLNGIASSLF